MSDREQLEQAIIHMEAQRAALGDAAADAAIAGLRQKLDALDSQPAEQQRKQATVLFADVSGFTAMSETMDAEDVADTMNALWENIDRAITDCGGLVDKHIGDAVMALWGTEEAREDDPERAIRGALAMQSELAAFRDERKVQLAMRVGINTGPVLLGDVGTTGEFTAMGDAVNLASRLEHAAPVGGILISHDTYRHVRGVFDVQQQEPLKVKGKVEPIQTYVVQRAKPRSFRMATRGVEGIETRMIGRDAELQTLQNTFRDVIEKAETRVVTIVADAGVGKSRLLYEFENWIELRPDEIYYFKGRAVPELRNIPYGIIRDMFRYRFDILESDSAATVLKKFRASMVDVLDADRADLVGHLIGFDFSASEAVNNLLGSPSFSELATAYLTNYLRALAAGPTVIFLEDLHWADDSSIDLISHLVTEIPKARLIVVCPTRPSLFEHCPNWGEGKDSYIRLDLKPLSEGDSRALVENILQKVNDIPTDLRDLIVNGAEGNPFYVEELIKMLVEDGVIERGEDRWRVETERLSEVRVPPTLTGVLQARLDSLPREEREVLQHASIVGRLFWDKAVAELKASYTSSDEVAPLLDDLHSRELIFRQERSAFVETGEYIFKHAILRDVTYETVLLKLRRVYHAQVANWLETTAKERLDEYLGLIAGHYEQAGETAKAVDYLRRSGEELNKISDYRGAIGAYERALAMTMEGDDAATRAVLLVKLGSNYYEMSDFSTAKEYLEPGLALAREAGERETEVAALYEFGRIALRHGKYDTARTRLEEVLSLAREINNSDGVANSLKDLGNVAAIQGEHEKAKRYYEESITICKKTGNRWGVAACLGNLGTVASGRGEYEVAQRYYEESKAICEEIGNRGGVSVCLMNLGVVVSMCKDFDMAQHYYQEALSISREIGRRDGIAICLNNLAHNMADQDEWGKSWSYYREALDESAATGIAFITMEALSGFARLKAKSEQYTRAAELLGLVLNHPATYEPTKQETEPIIDVLREKLPANEMEAAMERGKTLELDAVVAEILAEEWSAGSE